MWQGIVGQKMQRGGGTRKSYTECANPNVIVCAGANRVYIRREFQEMEGKTGRDPHASDSHVQCDWFPRFEIFSKAWEVDNSSEMRHSIDTA